MSFTYLRRAAIALALLGAAGCTVKSSQPPPLTGPSGLALTLRVNALPDAINQDGGSQSSVKVTAIGPDGKGLAALPLRLDMSVGGVVQDYGTLSARSVVTNSEGIATAVYTAPPGPVNGLFGTCAGVPGNCVSIVATATSSDFLSANPEQVTIRLVPTGVVQPPATTPVAVFTITPTPVNFNVASTFDASGSCGGPLSGSVCPAPSPGTTASVITNYAWSFGDGASGTGKTISHTYTQSTSPGNAYTVTLTVTNDRGLSSTTTQSVTVDASPAPSGDWIFSPTDPNAGETVFFNADGVKPAAGHTLVQFTWNFGDGATASGFQTSHVFSAPGSYTVVLSTTDDAGQKTVQSKTLTVGLGNPIPVVSVSKTGGMSINADGALSTFARGATKISSYTFIWGDGTQDVVNEPATSHTHTYPALSGGALSATYTVTLRVIDDRGRSATTSQTITLP